MLDDDRSKWYNNCKIYILLSVTAVKSRKEWLSLLYTYDDQALREKTAKLWAQLNNAPILPEHIHCMGCRMNGAKTVFCESLCGIRKCALQKGLATCGDCPELETCPTVGAILENNPSALENLKG